MGGRKFQPITDRIRGNMRIADGCWIWTSKLDRTGYGLIEFRIPGQGRASRHWRVAHVVSYEAFLGPVAAGRQLDHLCRNRACVNPQHLEPVTASVNVQRAVPFARKTTCSRDHPFTEANTRMRGSRRVCRECDRIRAAAYRARRAV
jgi:hypothetical protein